MQNWNAGKTEEYKERKEYVIERSELRHEGPLAEGEQLPRPGKRQPIPELEPVAVAAASEEKANEPILFATPTCPNCRIACSYLDKAGVHYNKLMADENAELVSKYGVKQAPTLVLPDGTKYAGAGAIKGYLNQRQ